MIEYSYKWRELQRYNPVVVQAVVNRAEDVARETGNLSTRGEIAAKILNTLHSSILGPLTEKQLISWTLNEQFVNGALQTGSICYPSPALVMDVRRAQQRVLPDSIIACSFPG